MPRLPISEEYGDSVREAFGLVLDQVAARIKSESARKRLMEEIAALPLDEDEAHQAIEKLLL